MARRLANNLAKDQALVRNNRGVYPQSATQRTRRLIVRLPLPSIAPIGCFPLGAAPQTAVHAPCADECHGGWFPDA